MPITRQGPVHNMDTQEKLAMLPANKRFTRAIAHRLLRLRNIEHRADATLDELLVIMQIHNVSVEMPAPGCIEPDVPADPKDWTESPADDGYPKHIGKLKALCKRRGLSFHPKAKRADLVRLLNGENFT
jgi:hypothetical protein